MRRLGVHTSIAGGLEKSLARAKELGCDTLQIFSHNPRGWALSDIAPEDASLFRKTREKLGLDPVFIHSCYLINLVSQSLEIRERSLWMLGEELARADAIGADYVILHMGRAAGPDGIGELALQIKSVTRRKSKNRFRAGLLFENTAGAPRKTGACKQARLQRQRQRARWWRLTSGTAAPVAGRAVCACRRCSRASRNPATASRWPPGSPRSRG